MGLFGLQAFQREVELLDFVKERGDFLRGGGHRVQVRGGRHVKPAVQLLEGGHGVGNDFFFEEGHAGLLLFHLALRLAVGGVHGEITRGNRGLLPAAGR